MYLIIMYFKHFNNMMVFVNNSDEIYYTSFITYIVIIFPLYSIICYFYNSVRIPQILEIPTFLRITIFSFFNFYQEKENFSKNIFIKFIKLNFIFISIPSPLTWYYLYMISITRDQCWANSIWKKQFELTNYFH